MPVVVYLCRFCLTTVKPYNLMTVQPYNRPNQYDSSVSISSCVISLLSILRHA